MGKYLSEEIKSLQRQCEEWLNLFFETSSNLGKTMEENKIFEKLNKTFNQDYNNVKQIRLKKKNSYV